MRRRTGRRAPALTLVLMVAALPARGGTAAPPWAWVLDSPMRSDLSGALEPALGSRIVNTPAGTRGRTHGGGGGDDVRINTPGDETLPTCTIQSEVHLARAGSNVVAGWNDLAQCLNGLAATPEASLSGYGWSDDDGATWHDGGAIPAPPGGQAFGDPVVAAGPGGEFYYATLASLAAGDPVSIGRSIIGVAKSVDGGRTFSRPVDATPGRPSTAAQDKEWLAVDTTGSAHRGNVYVAWVEFGETQEILFSRSVDGGTSFEDPIRLSRSPAQRGTGAQVAVGPDGEVHVVWISTVGAFAGLYFTRSLDGGISFAPVVRITGLAKIGHTRNCHLGGTRDVLDGDIRVREWPSLAVDVSGSADPDHPDHNPDRGRIYIAVPADGEGSDESDVYVLSSPDGGTTWTEKRKVNDDSTAADNFHPQVAVGPDGTAAVSWYDRRLSPANRDLDVFAAFSTDGGQTFSANQRVTDVSFPPAQTNPNTGLAAGCYMGEYNGMVAGDAGTFLLDWGDNRDTAVGLPDPNVYFDVVPVTPAES